MQSSCDPEQKAHVNIDVTISISPFAGFFPLSNFSFLPFSHFQLVSAGTYPAEGVQRAASSSDPLISSDLQAVETFGTWLGPLSLTSSSGGPSRNGNSLVSVQGVAAGRPPALSGRLLCPGKPRRGEGDSSRCSQPEELSCGRALAPTTRHIPAPSCESNWHSVAW